MTPLRSVALDINCVQRLHSCVPGSVSLNKSEAIARYGRPARMCRLWRGRGWWAGTARVLQDGKHPDMIGCEICSRSSGCGRRIANDFLWCKCKYSYQHDGQPFAGIGQTAMPYASSGPTSVIIPNPCGGVTDARQLRWRRWRRPCTACPLLSVAMISCI